MKRRIIGLVTALLVGLGVVVALQTPASAGVYAHRIIGSQSGLCLEVPNFSTAPNEQLRLNICNGGSNQVFNFIDVDYNWSYFITPAISSGQCLTPGVASLFNSTIVQWPCFWTAPQIWYLGFANDGTRILVNPYSGWCLGAEFAYPGALVRQIDCKGNNRRWVVA